MGKAQQVEKRGLYVVLATYHVETKCYGNSNHLKMSWGSPGAGAEMQLVTKRGERFLRLMRQCERRRPSCVSECVSCWSVSTRYYVAFYQCRPHRPRQTTPRRVCILWETFIKASAKLKMSMYFILSVNTTIPQISRITRR